MSYDTKWDSLAPPPPLNCAVSRNRRLFEFWMKIAIGSSDPFITKKCYIWFVQGIGIKRAEYILDLRKTEPNPFREVKYLCTHDEQLQLVWKPLSEDSWTDSTAKSRGGW